MTTVTSFRPAPALPRGLSFPDIDDDLLLTRDGDGLVRLWLRQPQGVSRHRCDEGSVTAWAAAEGLGDAVARQLGRKPPAMFAGLALDRPLLMGIVNVTPDSFSDGGRFLAADAAIAHGRALAAQGADIIDVGGESTRPGARAVSVDEEIARVRPVVAALAAEGLCVSIDSRNAAVMRAALAAGARIVNDVTGLTHDPAALPLLAGGDAAIVLGHIQGEPRTMQRAPHYDDAPVEVFDWLRRRAGMCRAAGIDPSRLCLDPGIGFGKSAEHNRRIIAELDLYRCAGLPLLLGVSRKSFLAALGGGEPAGQRLPGSLAAALAGLARGAHILRVHDVAETAQAVSVWRVLNDMPDR